MSKHSCASLVLRCIDFRIPPKNLSELLTTAGICHDGDYDLVSVAGAGKDLLSPDAAEKEFILKQIRISKKLHEIKNIYILMHDNCGAYGIADAAQEEKTQSEHLHTIREQLIKEFPDIQVKGLIVTGVPSGSLGLKTIL